MVKVKIHFCDTFINIVHINIKSADAYDLFKDFTDKIVYITTHTSLSLLNNFSYMCKYNINFLIVYYN